MTSFTQRGIDRALKKNAELVQEAAALASDHRCRPTVRDGAFEATAAERLSLEEAIGACCDRLARRPRGAIGPLCPNAGCRGRLEFDREGPSSTPGKLVCLGCMTHWDDVADDDDGRFTGWRRAKLDYGPSLFDVDGMLRASVADLERREAALIARARTAATPLLRLGPGGDFSRDHTPRRSGQSLSPPPQPAPDAVPAGGLPSR